MQGTEGDHKEHGFEECSEDVRVCEGKNYDAKYSGEGSLYDGHT